MQNKKCDKNVAILTELILKQFLTNFDFVLSVYIAVTSPIYGTINFDADRDSYDKRNKLKRQDAIDDRIRNPSYCRDVKAFLERCIPPPPSEAPPSDDDDDETYALSPLEFSSETLEKLNSLYSLYKGGRPISSKIDDETADVEYRLPKFNTCSARSLSDNTKTVCSLVSVTTSISNLN